MNRNISFKIIYWLSIKKKGTDSWASSFAISSLFCWNSEVMTSTATDILDHEASFKMSALMVADQKDKRNLVPDNCGATTGVLNCLPQNFYKRGN